MTDTFKFGHQLVLTIGAEHVSATVILASENGRSLMVEFDRAIRLGEGVYLGRMPLFLRDDDVWISIIDGMSVTLTRKQ